MIRDLARGLFNLQIKRAQLDQDEGSYQCQVGPSENNQPIRAGAIVSINVPPQELLLTSTSSICLPFKNSNSELNLNDPSLILTSLNISQFISNFNSTAQHSNFIQLINQFINNNNDQNNKLNKKLSKYRSSLPFVQLRETERLTLVCNTSGTKPETKLIWLRNNVVLKEDQYNTFIKSGLGNSGRLSSTKSSLTIFIKATEEGVIYSCVALHSSQKEPKIMLSVRISVLMPPGTPIIEGYKDNEQITAGDSLNLACIITNAGNPPAHLKWLRDNQILISNSQTIIRQQKKPNKNIIDNEIIEQSADDFWIDLNNDDETIDLSKLSLNKQSDVSRTLSIKVKPEDHFTTYSCQPSINQFMFTHHFRSKIASVRLNVQYPPSSIQLVGDHNALISQPNNLLRFGCACGPSNPAAQVKLSIDGKPLEIIFKQTEMHYSIDHNSIKTSNSLNLEHLLTTFDNLNRKLNGFINFGNSSTSLNKIFIDKQKHYMQRKKQIKVSCTAIHPLLTNTLISEYDLQLLYPPNPPKLVLEPNHSQFAGEYKRFICSATDGNPIAQLKFYEQKEGKINHIPLQSTTNSIGNNNQNSISTLDLLLTPNENGATIICKIDHPALLTPSFISKQIEVYFFNEQLNLTTETSFKSTNKQQQLNNDEWKLNDEFSLICKAGPCNPQCNLDWYLNNNKLNSASKRFLILNEQSVSSTNGGIVTISRLNINSLQITDHDHRIECVQSNSLFNQTTRKDYTIHVLHPPVFDTKNNPKFFDVWENDTLQFEFIAKGYPNSINYEFYFDSYKLQNSNYFQIQGPKILFKHVALSSGGQYRIEATNSQGKTSHQFNVNVLYSPKLISSTTLLYLNQNQTVKINCTVSANPISQLRSEWQKLNLFDKFSNQYDVSDDEKLETNDVMYSSITENNESENDENELLKERLAYSYLWNSPNLDWWWSNQQSISSSYFSDNTFNTANSHFQTDYKLFNTLNSSIHYNQKVISKNNELFMIANDTFTTIKKNQQQYYLATATHTIESFLNDTDYLCLIHFNPNEKTEITRTPNTNKQQLEQLSIVTTRIALRQKKRPLLLNCNSLELPVLLNHIKEQVLDYHLSNRNQNQVNQNNNNKKAINNINNNRKSILVAVEPGDSISFYCTAIRGALMLQFSWRDVKHGQLLGAISHTFVQPSIESSWRRSLNSSFNDNHHYQQSSLPYNKNDLNTYSNYTVKLHFNPKLPELITAELRLAKVSLDHFSTQFQCLISNELGSDSRIYELRRKSVPDQIGKVHIRNLNNNKLVLQWEPGFDGGFNQQYIVRFSLKNELERALQSKQFSSNTHTDNDLQHPNNVYSRESLNELRRMKVLEGNEILASEQDDDEQNLKEESDKMNSDIQWRTEQNTAQTTKYAHNHYNIKKKKNLKKRIQWNGYLLSPTGPLAQIGNEKLVSNETQIEFTDLKPLTEYYFTVLSKNRLGLAKRHSIPILIKTPKSETNEDNSDQVKSNLQLGENSLGLIENGFLINASTKNLTLWLFIIVICFIILVNVVIFSIYHFRKRAAKQLTGSLTTDTVRTGSSSTNSTQSTALSSNLNTPQQQTKNLTINKNLNSNSTEYDENQIEPNENQTNKVSKNENDEIELDDNTKSKNKDENCIMKNNNNNNNNDDILFKNNVTFALLANPITNSNYITATNTLTKSNQVDYLNNKHSSTNSINTNVLNNQSTNAALVYAQLRSDNSVTNNLIHSNDLIQAKTIENNDLNSRYGNYATLNPLVNHQLDNNAILNNNLDNYNKNNFKTNLQTRINKLSTDYKDKYIPYYLNENLLTNFETDLNCDSWNNMSNLNNTITDFYSTKLISSNSLLASSTPSPSTITYSSQLPHIITSSSLATTTLSPLDHLTPSTAYSTTYQTTSPSTLANQLSDDNQIRLNNYDNYISPTFTNQQSPLLIQTLTKNHSSNHFLINDYCHQTDNLQNFNSNLTTNSYRGNSKKSPNKSHCKMVSFQDNYYK